MSNAVTNDEEGEQDFRASRITPASQHFFRKLAIGVGVGTQTASSVGLVKITEDAVVVSVPNERAGRLIGRRGMYFRAMEELCHKQVRIAGQSERG